MYVLRIYFENAKINKSGQFRFCKNQAKIRKWTQLPAHRSNRELLQLIALVCGGPRFLPHLPWKLQQLSSDSSIPLRLETIMAAHACDTSCKGLFSRQLLGSGIQIDKDGKVKRLFRKECRFLPSNVPVREIGTGTGNTSFLLLAYGSVLKPHCRTDDFTFSDPFFRVTRFYSLFNKQALLTDPAVFLSRLHYKGVMVSRYPAIQTMKSLKELFKKYLDIETGHWLSRECDFHQEWSRLYPWQKRAALPVLDAARHMIDAFPKSGKPLDMPGLLLLDRPDLLCTEKNFPFVDGSHG